MEIRHLRYFVTVAEELHFGRAAARLHMATSPLSRRVQDLERELGVALFVRRHHHLSLTAEGEILLAEARQLLDRLAALPALLGRGTRLVELGVAPDVAPELRDAVLAALHGRHPGAEVRVRPASTGPLVAAVLARDVDLALVHGPVDEAALSSLAVGSTPIMVAVGAGAGFDDRPSVTLSDLAHLPYASISYDAAPLIYRPTDRMLTRAGITGRIVLDGHDLNGLAHVVATGGAFTFVGIAGATRKAFVGEPVRILPVADMPARLRTVAVWRTDHPGWDVADVVAPLATGGEPDRRSPAPA